MYANRTDNFSLLTIEQHLPKSPFILVTVSRKQSQKAMPIITTRLEPQIYLVEWSGIITAADVLAAMLHISAMADAYSETRYVMMLDLQHVVTFPLDTRYYGQIANYDPRLSGALVFNFPALARTLGRIVSRFTDRPIRFCDHQKHAEAIARTILHGAQPGVASSGGCVRL